jgi:Fungal specific transcription factor domain/Fungal Zn(2)-Cys(6) binuclear cluster domain
MFVPFVNSRLDARNIWNGILLHTRGLDLGFVSIVEVGLVESKYSHVLFCFSCFVLDVVGWELIGRDVMYRHHNTCQAAHDAGYRRGTVAKKSKRRSCERCSRLKCKCDDQSPCTRCVAAGVECHREVIKQPPPPVLEEEELAGIHLLAHHAAQTPKEVLSPAAVMTADNFSTAISTSQSIPFPDPFQQETVIPLNNDESILFDWGLFDANIGTMDTLLPDTDEILREMFKTLNHPQTNPLQGDPGAILPDPTVDEQLCDWNSVSIAMNKIDPLESHRLTINQHLLRYGTDKEDIAWLSPKAVREMLYCYFRHFHRHTPIIHLPTWDISTTPSSLLLTMILLGAVYSDKPDLNYPHARRIAPAAKELIYKLDPVSSQPRLF